MQHIVCRAPTEDFWKNTYKKGRHSLCAYAYSTCRTYSSCRFTLSTGLFGLYALCVATDVAHVGRIAIGDGTDAVAMRFELVHHSFLTIKGEGSPDMGSWTSAKVSQIGCHLLLSHLFSPTFEESRELFH